MPDNPRNFLAVVCEDFDRTADGRRVDRYRLTNRASMIVDILTFGARIQAIQVPDKNGTLDDVALGFDSVAEYIEHSAVYFGATIGRYGNRIGGAAFDLNGRTYELSANEGPNTLHGGKTGFDSAVWAASPIDEGHVVGVELTHLSADGDMGFPGNLAVTLRYTLDDANNLRLHYSAIADADTVVNLTNHAYFNLAGAGSGPIGAHMALINADRFTAIDGAGIPTGELPAVAQTAMDFTSPKPIGAEIDAEMIRDRSGYDHNWVLNTKGDLSRLAVQVIDPVSGRGVEMYTTEPSVQFYTSNGLDGSFTGKNGQTYARYGAFALEAQHHPDSPNQPSFPSTKLAAGEKYTQTTVYRFSPS